MKNTINIDKHSLNGLNKDGIIFNSVSQFKLENENWNNSTKLRLRDWICIKILVKKWKNK